MAVIEKPLALAVGCAVFINIEERDVEAVIAARRGDPGLYVGVAAHGCRRFIFRIGRRLACGCGAIEHNRLGAHRLQAVGQAWRHVEHPAPGQDLWLLAVDGDLELAAVNPAPGAVIGIEEALAPVARRHLDIATIEVAAQQHLLLPACLLAVRLEDIGDMPDRPVDRAINCFRCFLRRPDRAGRTILAAGAGPPVAVGRIGSGRCALCHDGGCAQWKKQSAHKRYRGFHRAPQNILIATNLGCLSAGGVASAACTKTRASPGCYPAMLRTWPVFLPGHFSQARAPLAAARISAYARTGQNPARVI